MIEFEKTLLNTHNIGCVKTKETVDKFSSRHYEIEIISLSGDHVCSFTYNTQKECDEKFIELKNIFQKRSD